MKHTYVIGQDVRVVKTDKLSGNEIGPPGLVMGEKKKVLDIVLDGQGNQHLDLGIKSDVNFVSSYETAEVLPNSQVGGVHWCHPSRVEPIE